MQSLQQVENMMTRAIRKAELSQDCRTNWANLKKSLSEYIFYMLQDTQMHLDKFNAKEGLNMSFELTLPRDRMPGKVPLNKLVEHVKYVLQEAGYTCKITGCNKGILVKAEATF